MVSRVIGAFDTDANNQSSCKKFACVKQFSANVFQVSSMNRIGEVPKCSCAVASTTCRGNCGTSLTLARSISNPRLPPTPPPSDGTPPPDLNSRRTERPRPELTPWDLRETFIPRGSILHAMTSAHRKKMTNIEKEWRGKKCHQ